MTLIAPPRFSTHTHLESNLHAKRQQTHLLQQQIAASKEQHVLELQYEALTQQIVAFDGVEAMKA